MLYTYPQRYEYTAKIVKKLKEIQNIFKMSNVIKTSFQIGLRR